jgi:2-polyprenyl-6-methoxyphenol hydroxylase-like FAD-dependent oxidoreductase
MTHVLVVGAGIGGLAASLVLSRVVDKVTLVERSEQPAEVGAALALQANGMAVLSRLGLLSAVERVGSRIDQARICNVGGTPLVATKCLISAKDWTTRSLSAGHTFTSC